MKWRVEKSGGADEGRQPLNRASRPCRSAKPPAEGRSFSYTAAAPRRRPSSVTEKPRILRCFLLFEKIDVNRKKNEGGVPPCANIAPRWPKMSSKMAQHRPNLAPRWPKMAQHRPKMAPRWPNMGPTWPQDRPNMAPRWLNIAPRCPT